MPKSQVQDDEALLTEIRDNFRYYSSAWKDIHDEGNTDMRYLAGDPWEPAERKEREDANRPVMAPDELNQYVNQIVNDVRMNKRSIKVTPKGNGANDKTAELRQDHYRGIEYESNAQTAYTTAFEGSVGRGYGFARVVTEFESSSSLNRVIRIKRIPNPDTVLMDPDCQEYDGSDAKGCFVIDVLSYEQFKRNWPKAKIKSFDPEDRKMAPQWIKPKSLIVAEYWKVIDNSKTLIQMDGEEPEVMETKYKGAKVYNDDENGQQYLDYQGKKTPIKGSRRIEDRQVMQYITNGVEILERKKIAGKYIRIIPCYGREKYVDDGSGSKRILESLIRLARTPYKMYCFVCSQQAEEAAMTPRVPWVGYKGQFEGNIGWDTAHVVPQAWLEANAQVDAATGQVLPLPTRPQFQPNFEGYELLKEGLKRSIQAACGMFNSSVGRHDTNVKSGKAIDKLDTISSQGNYHFIDNFDRFLQHVGRVVDNIYPFIYDTPRSVTLRKADGSHEVVRINDPEFIPQGADKPIFYDAKTGEHDVTIDTGPSFESEREAANNLAQTLMNNEMMAPRIADLAVKAMNIGPLGDQIAERLTPPEFAKEGSPQQMQGMLQQAKQQVQALDAGMQQLHAELQKLQQEKQSKIIEKEYDYKRALLDAKVKIVTAEISTKAQISIEREQMLADAEAQLHNESHDAALAAADAGHEAAMGAQGHQQATELADQGAMHAQTAAARASEQQPAQ